MVLLTIDIKLYTESPELTHRITGSLYPLTNFSQYLQPSALGNHHSSLYYYEFGFFKIPHISEIIQYLSFSDLLHLGDEHSILKFHPCCYKWPDFPLYYGRIIFLLSVCVYLCLFISHFLYLFIRW